MEHVHDHGHGHLHDHDHHHDDQSTYYLEQLCMIALGGALGGVCVMLWLNTYVWKPADGQVSMLQLILAPNFHLPVLLGGIGLLFLVLVRAVAVWVASGKPAAAQSHSHSRDHEHDHDHSHCDDHGHCHDHDHVHEHVHDDTAGTHAHDHGHEHGWSPWRYVFLVLPVALYFLNVPSKGLSIDVLKQDLVGGEEAVASKGYLGPIEFKDLKNAAATAEGRDAYSGQTVQLKGQYVKSGQDNMFSLIRFKMRCCAADAVPSDVVIIAEKPVTDLNPMDWVEVEGVVEFRKRANRNEYVPVLHLKKVTKVKPLTDLYM